MKSHSFHLHNTSLDSEVSDRHGLQKVIKCISENKRVSRPNKALIQVSYSGPLSQSNNILDHKIPRNSPWCCESLQETVDLCVFESFDIVLLPIMCYEARKVKFPSRIEGNTG